MGTPFQIKINTLQEIQKNVPTKKGTLEFL
uniref:Uncharacterized protein n=1 Tax=Salmonella phage vB_STmST19_KE08 TaxID=3161165 RepID=A0AAU8GDV8_9CAUD